MVLPKRVMTIQLLAKCCNMSNNGKPLAVHKTPSLSLSLRPPAEPPPIDTTLQSAMTDNMSYPDLDAVSVSSNNTFNSLDSNDSLFGIPPLARRGSFSSSDEGSVNSPNKNLVIPSDDNDDESSKDEPHLFHCSNCMDQYAVEIVTSESSFDTAYEDDRSISTTGSLFLSTFDDLGPPPPGSLMDSWDIPFSTSCLHNFTFPGDDAKCFTATSDTDETESLSVSSLELANDDDTYAEFNPIQPHPVLSLTRVRTTVQVKLDSALDAPTLSTTSCQNSELIDTGGNFNMTNDLSSLINVIKIKPFTIGMAANESNSTLQCTHRGDFPIPMLDGSTFYTPVFFNASASDTILSPEAICYASNGLLSRWSQSGAPDENTGTVTFYSDKGTEVISLVLHKHNGLYYSSVNTIGVNLEASSSASCVDCDIAVYFHTEDDSDDDVSLDFDDGLEYPDSPPRSDRNTRAPLEGPTPSGPTMPSTSVPTPKLSARSYVLKSKQVEADLWQARLGHCSDWQLKVIPMSTTGTPSKFTPHPFAS
jgi:hypothetical protein